MDSAFNKKLNKRFIISLAIIISLAFLWMIKGFVITIILAAITAGLFYKIYLHILKRIKKKGLSSAIVVILVLLVFVIPLTLFIGVVVDQASEISKDLVPVIREEIEKGKTQGFSLPEWLPFRDQLAPYQDEIIKKLSEFSSNIGNIIVTSLTSITQGTFLFFLQLFVFLYALFYFLMNGEKYLYDLRKYIPMEEDDFDKMLDKGLSVTRATIKGALFIGVLQGALIGIAFAIIGIKGAAFWGAICIVLSLIPSIGSGLVWVPAAIWLFIKGKTFAAIALAIWGGVVVGSLDNILRPKLIGQDTKMSDLMILLSTLGGLGLFGIIGFILGPILAGLVITIWQIYAETFFESKLSNDRISEE